MIENIYCAGDFVEHNEKLYGIWNASKVFEGKISVEELKKYF
jgi:hypothetical protein